MRVRGRALHFGVQLQGQFTSWGEYASALAAVEEIGFGSVWAFDHLLPYAGPDDGAAFETLTTMSAMALLTSRARIGVLVNGNLYRHPAVLAKAAAQVDQMSGGRLDFSLGAAWSKREFDAYGLEFPSLSERYARLDEALELIKLLWDQHRTTFRGRFYQVSEAPCEPKPLQSPHPPVTIGGTGLGSLRAAAKHGDRLNMVGSPETCSQVVRRLEELCNEIGRNFDHIELSVHPSVAIAARREEAQAHAQATAGRLSLDLAAQAGRWLIGTPDEVAHELRRYLEVGVNHFVFAVGPPFDLAPLRLLEEEVLPALEES
ncbi:MAG TPA: LLM class flavin-dependent oxidoreductase [Acidimicrobiales bacterium]|nr:LLM class flavin-dependent oxidoreductase [Acidimicrobiales bacterium]